MDMFLKKLSRNISTIFQFFFLVSRKMDYKRLARFMLGINEMHNLESMLQEASKCLKEILNYRLFAFAVLDKGKLDVWIDPGVYRRHLKKIIQHDFVTYDSIDIHSIYNGQNKSTKIGALDSSSLMSKSIMCNGYLSRLYILPTRRFFLYHGEVTDIILKTLSLAFTNFISIKSLENAAAIDPLTSCYNRRELNRYLEHLISDTFRHKSDLSVIMFDIDQFKMVNDCYGHQTGDEVLKKISQVILAEIRKGDYLSRYGGDEFVAVLPHTKTTKAMELAERLRKIIEDTKIEIEDRKIIHVTASFGVSSLKNNSDKQGLLKEADAMLYKAKASGRNAVVPQMKLCGMETLSKT